ncbi:hypothetical protein [Nocardioides panaciterrulae]|uniref:Uncharacterized protein n=1 Tax=Nocardioides panaciterrulae TaxID=661492 RepID=A0A7Y9E8E8_9ACTN|nr:hypothetical protein [Nocardioides panaciterrulae]NYD43023.1 hypothetical protein [Nocardioides panaciterrulae]
MVGWGIWTLLLAVLLGGWVAPADTHSASPGSGSSAEASTMPSPGPAPGPAHTSSSAPPLVAPAAPQSWHGFAPDADGTLVRIAIDDGYGSAMLSLSSDGRVVRVGDTSVNATRDAFVTWRVSGAGLDRALGELARLGILDAEPGAFGQGGVTPSGRSVAFFFGAGGVVSGSEESPRFPSLWRTATRLADPTSYADDLVSGPEPWVPDEIGLLFSRPDAANPYPMAAWPFDEPIEQMAVPAPAGSPGELAVCLRGEDAAKLFAALPGGVVGVFRWSDGTATWSARVDVTTPGYRLYGSGCDPV